MKAALVSALNAKLESEANGPDSFLAVLGEGRSTGRQKNQTYFGEWRPEVPARTPFVGIEIFDTRQQIPGAPTVRLFRSLVVFHCYSTDQLKTAILADGVQRLFTQAPFGENPDIWFYDFSSDKIRVLNSQFLVRNSGMYDHDRDQYEEMIQIQCIWTDVLCGRESTPIKHCPCPPPEDSPVGNC